MIIMMNINNENLDNYAALILSVCYGIQTDVAVKMTNCNGTGKDAKQVALEELNKFFTKYFDKCFDVFLDYAENNMSVKELAKKHNTTVDTIRRCLNKTEVYYKEFYGLIELGYLYYTDNPRLFQFMARCGNFFVKEKKKANKCYELYQDYLENKISKNNLMKITHMTTATLAEL